MFRDTGESPCFDILCPETQSLEKIRDRKIDRILLKKTGRLEDTKYKEDTALNKEETAMLCPYGWGFGGRRSGRG